MKRMEGCTCVHSAMVTLKAAVLVSVLERQRLSRRIRQRIWDINAGGPDLREGGEMSERRGWFGGHLAGKYLSGTGDAEQIPLCWKNMGYNMGTLG